MRREWERSTCQFEARNPVRRDISALIEEDDERANLSDNCCTCVDASCVTTLRLRSTGAWSVTIGRATIGEAHAAAPASFRRPRLSWSARLEGWSLASRIAQRSGRLVVGCGRILVFLSRADRR